MRCCLAAFLVMACGRIGFEPAGQSSGSADATARSCMSAPACSGMFTCCETTGIRCVPDHASCTGEVATCDGTPPYDGCNPDEVCCIISPEPQLRCLPASLNLC